MAVSKVDDEKLLERLCDVFRRNGFEGASLSMIAEATGLQRASLYHRFPGGKDEMAQAVLAWADQRFVSHILAPLSESGEPAKRVRKMAKRLGEFFESGSQTCLLEALGLGAAKSGLRKHVQNSFCGWRDAMTAIARESGATPAVARRRAEDALVQIQGGLVFARTGEDTRPFQRVIGGLPELLTGSRDE